MLLLYSFNNCGNDGPGDSQQHIHGVSAFTIHGEKAHALQQSCNSNSMLCMHRQDQGTQLTSPAHRCPWHGAAGTAQSTCAQTSAPAGHCCCTAHPHCQAAMPLLVDPAVAVCLHAKNNQLSHHKQYTQQHAMCYWLSFAAVAVLHTRLMYYVESGCFGVIITA